VTLLRRYGNDFRGSTWRSAASAGVFITAGVTEDNGTADLG
jgi:hypothetical protein